MGEKNIKSMSATSETKSKSKAKVSKSKPKELTLDRIYMLHGFDDIQKHTDEQIGWRERIKRFVAFRVVPIINWINFL